MEKICIIKLGALGDVVRTLPILVGIKEKFPESEIFWVTKKDSFEIVDSSPYVKKVFLVSENISESFDILYNFDVEHEAVELAKKINAGRKFGFNSEDNFISAFNLSSEYYLNTMFDDELKKTNKKTYQEMIFMAAEIPYKKQHHGISLKKEHEDYSQKFMNENGIKSKKIIGIHFGAGSKWPSKIWHKENLKEFIKKAKTSEFEIILFGGPNEISDIAELKKYFSELGMKIHANNPKNSSMEFASVADKCDFMLCSDSFSLHISLALKKPTIGLFFCTSPDEVEGYGYLRKIISPMLYDFFPEKMDQYDEKLVRSISADEVLSAIIEMQDTNK